MEPTSPTFVWLLRILLTVAVLWVVIRWDKAAGRGVLQILRRLVSLAVVVVLGTLAVLVPVNAQWGWYTSWSDVASLFVPQPVVPAGKTTGANPAAAAAAQVGPSPLLGLPTTERDRAPLSLTRTSVGGYETVTVPGPISGYTGQVTIWFPPSYGTPAGAGRTYPVIEGFHGYLPAPKAFFTVFHIDQVIGRLSSEHRLNEPIVVIPHWAPNRLDTECVDGGAGNIRMETWLTQDVPRWVYTHYRVSAERTSWSAVGASAGGWCALMSSFLHPRQYGTAIAMAGYTSPVFDPSYVPFGPTSELGRRYDLTTLERRTPPAVAVWALTSRRDALTYKPTVALAQDARAPLSVTPTVLPGGGHRAEVWVPYFPEALTWLGRTSRGFAPR